MEGRTTYESCLLTTKRRLRTKHDAELRSVMGLLFKCSINILCFEIFLELKNCNIIKAVSMFLNQSFKQE